MKSNMSTLRLNKLRKKPATDIVQKPKKKIDRFNGLTEEDLQTCKLPDILKENLEMVFVGINPSLTAAYCGRYYAGPGNHFYKLLHESKLTPRLFHHEEDSNLLEYGIGLTNIVERPSRSSSDLKKSEIKEGAKKVEKKLIAFKPKVAIFNGKGIYEVFSNRTSKSDFNFGLQPVRIGNTAIWVVPSSSARCAHFPRMVDKLHFYSALKKYLLYIDGKISDIDEREFFFDGKCKIFDPTTSIMWRRKGMSAFMHGGRVANKDTLLNASETSISDIDIPKYDNVKRMKIKVDNSEMIKCEDLFDKDSAESTESSNHNVEDVEEDELESFDEDKKREEKEEKNIKVIKQQHEIDFVNLIKQRLTQKEEKSCDDNDTEESSKIFQPVTHKKHAAILKYAMLKKNRSHSLSSSQNTQINSSDFD